MYWFFQVHICNCKILIIDQDLSNGHSFPLKVDTCSFEWNVSATRLVDGLPWNLVKTFMSPSGLFTWQTLIYPIGNEDRVAYCDSAALFGGYQLSLFVTVTAHFSFIICQSLIIINLKSKAECLYKEEVLAEAKEWYITKFKLVNDGVSYAN